MKKILFRADAHQVIGTGDLVSLIQLSKHFRRDGWETHFLIKDYQAGKALADKHDLPNLTVVPADLAIDDEVKAINAYVDDKSVDVVFFEITERKLSDYRGLTERALMAAICFDGALPDGMDLVVDWDVAAASYFSQENHPGTRFLFGPAYVVLPPDLDLRAIAGRKYNRPPKKVLITMGGADEHNFTERVVASLVDQQVDLELEVIIGAGYSHRTGLEAVLARSGYRYTLEQNVNDMFDRYLNCDVAVSAGGLTSSELVATRTPAALIATHEHQVARCKYFQTQSLAVYLGFRDFPPDQLAAAVLNPLSVPQVNFFEPMAIKDAVDDLIKRR